METTTSKLTKKYQEWFKNFQGIYPSLKDLNKQLRSSQG